MRKRLAYLAVATSVLSGGAARAEDHLVSLEAAQSRLSEVTRSRSHDVATLERALSTPRAASTARALGADVREVRGAVASLGDRELRELASRAAALEADPVAGLDKDIHDLLIVFLIVAIVIVVLKAV